jgi:hypothetical protein
LRSAAPGKIPPQIRHLSTDRWEFFAPQIVQRSLV